MATFRILSWNVETFGETKLASVSDYIATVVAYASPDIALIIETTKMGQAELAHTLPRALEEKTRNSWVGFGSDATGKAVELPEKILKSEWPRLAELSSYLRTLQLCYDNKPRALVRKSGLDPRNENVCREALESAGVIRKDLETYTALFRYDPTVWDDGRGALVALRSNVGLSKQAPAVLRTTDSNGGEIGYANPTSDFTGRAPWVINLYFAKPGAAAESAAQFPLACFHAPFKVPGGRATRAAANAGLMRLGTREQGTEREINLVNQPYAAVAGDFNVDFDWNVSFQGLRNPVVTGTPNVLTYGAYSAAGFTLPVREKTTLTAVESASTRWEQSTAFRANAYDNVMVRYLAPDGLVRGVQAGAIDLVADTFARAANYLRTVPGIPNRRPPRMYDAFEYVRENVSDHLPVVCDLQVDDRS